MTKLSVNVNKVATLRNARGKNLPNVLGEAQKIVSFGAHGITVHPRPDGRHIRWPDVYELKENLSVELNIEGYPSSDFLQKVIEIKPAQCTLVPDPPDVLTSNAGWKIFGNEELLASVVSKLKAQEIRTSFFVDPKIIDMKELLFLRDIGADRIELYTETYAEAQNDEQRTQVIGDYKRIATLAQSMGLGINAGHDLNLDNLSFFDQQIPELSEVSIGHALVCDALNFGWETTIKKYLDCLKDSETA